MTYHIPRSDDQLRGDAGLPSHAHLADFWRWAFSDLCEDYIKGIFAEWMVGSLLGFRMLELRRISYANSDFLWGDRLRIEVRATAYWQSWRVFDEEGRPRSKPIDPIPVSRIRFGSLRKRAGAAGNNATTPPGYKSDVYVFCLQTERDLARWDALDLSQWEFYVLQRSQLEQLDTSGISLTKLKRLTEPMTARQFQQRMRSELGGV